MPEDTPALPELPQFTAQAALPAPSQAPADRMRWLRYLRTAARWTSMALLATWFVFGTLVLSVRWLVLPNVDHWRGRIEQAASAALQAPVSIGRIETAWSGLDPHLSLTDVRVLDQAGATALGLPRLEATLSWRSVLTLQARFSRIAIFTPSVEIRRLPGDRFEVAGWVLGGSQKRKADAKVLDWLLSQPRVEVHDASVRLVDASGAEPPERTVAQRTFDLQDVQIALSATLAEHRFSIQARPPSALAGVIDVRGVFTQPWFAAPSAIERWSGRLFAQVDYADLGALQQRLAVLPPPLQVRAAEVALQAWLDIDQSRLTGLVVDSALKDVDASLGADLPPLQLSAVQGRVVGRRWGNLQRGGEELQVHGFSIVSRGLSLPPTNMKVRREWVPGGSSGGAGTTQQRLRTAFDAGVLPLSTLTELAARLPLRAEIRRRVAAIGLNGTLTDVQTQWQGAAEAPESFNARAKFSGLGRAPTALSHAAIPASSAGAHDSASDFAAEAHWPAFANLTGSIEATEAGGSLALDSRNGWLALPGLMTQRLPRLPFANLVTTLRWQQQPAVQVRIEGLRLNNADFDISAAGSWSAAASQPQPQPQPTVPALRNAPAALIQTATPPLHVPLKGPGRLDLGGTIGRLSAARVHAYTPASTSPKLQRWLTLALRSGELVDGTFRIRGDLADFPFAEGRNGEFRAGGRFVDATLDYLPFDPSDPAALPGWPAASALVGELRFEGNRMTVNAQQGRIYGVTIGPSTALLAPLGGPDPVLSLGLRGAGPVADMLRYVGSSPIGGWLGHFLDDAQATGPARLQLDLDVPLEHPEQTALKGTVTLQGNDVNLTRNVAPFSRAQGDVHFTQRSLSISGLTAGYLGGSTRVEVQTQADQTIVLTASGTATPQGTRLQAGSAIVERLLDHAQGTTRYGARLEFAAGRTKLDVDSDLTGWALDLPPPLEKPAATALPLRIEWHPLTGNPTRSGSSEQDSSGTSNVATDSGQRDEIKVRLGNLVNVHLQRSDIAAATAHIDRGAVGIGTMVSPPAAGILVSVDQPRLALDPWLPLLQSLGNGKAVSPPSTRATRATRATRPTFSAAETSSDKGAEWVDPAAAAPAEVAVDYVNLRADELTIGGKPLAHVVLGATRQTHGAWIANIASDHATGALTWQPADQNKGAHLSARLARLHIPDSQGEQLSAALDAPVIEIPALDVVADDFQLGGHALGQLTLEASNRGNAWQLHKLTIKNADATMAASGNWERDADHAVLREGRAEGPSAVRRMALSMNLSFADGGNLLTRLGVPGALRGGAGSLSGEITWRGTPFSIDYPSLSGHLTLAVARGQFLKADPGSARLLSLISLQSLPRRLFLDFSDVFSQGFGFDAITATAKIDAGVLATQDFKMRGPAANVLMDGHTDLRTETQQLRILVLPEINAGSASLVYALLANPGVGLGTFLAQLLLRDPLSKAFSYELDVTGSWADPQVKRRERSKSRDPDSPPN